MPCAMLQERRLLSVGDLCETEGTHMDDKKQQSEESQIEASVLRLREEFHQFLQECRDCRREIEAHWQLG